MECQFGYVAAHRIGAEQRRRMQLLSIGGIADLLARRVPKVAVTDAGAWVLGYSPEDAKRVEAELNRNYRVILDKAPVKVWLRNDATPVL